MSKILHLAAAVVICSAATTASAQEPVPSSPLASAASTGPKNTLTVNPLPLIIGMVSAEYERVIREDLSFYVAPTYWNLTFSPGDDEFNIFAYGLGIGARYFVTGVAPEGFWLAPGVEVAYAGAKYNGAEGSSMAYGMGAQLGYTWLIGDVFDISLGLGAAYSDNEVEVEYEEAGLERTKIEGRAGFSPTLRFAIGAAF